MHWPSIATAGVVFAGVAFADAAPKEFPFPLSCDQATAMRYTYGLAPEWQITKVLGGLRQPRTIIFDTNGNMLILQATTGISVHTFGSNGCVNSSTTIVTNRGLNHGLSLTPDGKTLYASSITTAWAWDYDASTMKVSNQRVVVKGMSQGIHSTRTLAVVPQAPNLILLQVGSNSNWDYESGNPATGRAIVKVFDMNKVPDGGYNYNTQGQVLGYGMRNEIGLTFDPAGHVWGVENSGDDFRRTTPDGASVDVHIDNPAEKLNYLGDPTKPNSTWYGYPTCFTVWEPSLFKDTTFKTGDQFVVSPNETFTDDDCIGKATPPRLAMMAHSAPIAAAFDKGASNLYITFHGSWDRQPATGYKVVQVPFLKLPNGLYDPVALPDSQKGYNDILWAADPGACRSQSLTMSNCWRLAGLAWDPSGKRMFVSSDNNAEGELFVMAKK